MYDNNARITIIFREFYLILEGFLVNFEYTEQLVTNPRSIEKEYSYISICYITLIFLTFCKQKIHLLEELKLCNNY